MILVTTGISGAPFDRLLAAVDKIDANEEIVVQHGPSLIRPARAACHTFLPFDRLSTLVAEANFVVTHAGAGSVLVALAHNKRPVVVPRRPEFAEVVDDHQVVFARHLAESGLAILAEDPVELPELLASRPETELQSNGHRAVLTEELASYLRSVVAEGITPTRR